MQSADQPRSEGPRLRPPAKPRGLKSLLSSGSDSNLVCGNPCGECDVQREAVNGNASPEPGKSQSLLPPPAFPPRLLMSRMVAKALGLSDSRCARSPASPRPNPQRAASLVACCELPGWSCRHLKSESHNQMQKLLNSWDPGFSCSLRSHCNFALAIHQGARSLRFLLNSMGFDRPWPVLVTGVA